MGWARLGWLAGWLGWAGWVGLAAARLGLAGWVGLAGLGWLGWARLGLAGLGWLGWLGWAGLEPLPCFGSGAWVTSPFPWFWGVWGKASLGCPPPRLRALEA